MHGAGGTVALDGHVGDLLVWRNDNQKDTGNRFLSISRVHRWPTPFPAVQSLLQLKFQPLERSREISANVFCSTDGAETKKRYKEDGSVRHICNNKNTATVKSSRS